MAEDHYDVVVLGGGSGGYAAALRLAELGRTVAVVEKDRLGGTCLHRGCIPTKTMLRSAEIVETIHAAATRGVTATVEAVDPGALAQHRDEVVDGLYRGLSGLVTSRGITVLEGSGALLSASTVRVASPDGATRDLSADHVVIATGSVPRTIPGVEVDHERVLTSDDALTLTAVPGSVVILGAGAIGCEFASIWSAFGAEVTLVEALGSLVPTEDAEIGEALAREFSGRGMRVMVSTRVQGVRHQGGGVDVHLEDGTALHADLVLVATGRAPVSDGIGLDAAGVATDRGFVTVDDHGRTSNPAVFAVGDVVPTLQLAHAGFAEGVLVAETIAGLDPAPIDYAGVPRVTYSHPEVASVGLTSEEAREAGHEVEEARYDLGGNGRARILGTAGFVKVVAAKDGPVLGVHMLGERVGELIAEAQLVVNWDARPDEVARHIHAHPTLSEAIGEAHLALAGKPLHSHG